MKPIDSNQQKSSLPLFYFKPTICWVDDDPVFLDAVKFAFSEKYHFLAFTNPHQALEFLSTYTAPLSKLTFTREFTESDIFDTNNHFPVDINIPAITSLLDSPSKSDEIALLVVDYNMPKMNGLEMCQKLKGTSFKKILLTGEAKPECAIAAFNNNWIDRFIEKTHDVTDHLQPWVEEMVYQFFCEKSQHIISHIEASRLSPLSDPFFEEQFNEWKKINDIQEYYLINRQGGFIAKNRDGKLFYYLVMSERDKAEFIEVNEEIFAKTGGVFQGFIDGKLLPFFGKEKESWQYAAEEWEKHFYPAQVLQGREKYYWAIINT